MVLATSTAPCSLIGWATVHTAFEKRSVPRLLTRQLYRGCMYLFSFSFRAKQHSREVSAQANDETTVQSSSVEYMCKHSCPCPQGSSFTCLLSQPQHNFNLNTKQPKKLVGLTRKWDCTPPCCHSFLKNSHTNSKLRHRQY